MTNDSELDDVDYGKPGEGFVTIHSVPLNKLAATRKLVRRALDGFYTPGDLRRMIVSGDQMVTIEGLQPDDIPTVVDAIHDVLDGRYPIVRSDQPEQETE